MLVEGPPDAQDVLPLIVHEQMQPPVALLVYKAGDPRMAAYFPFTVFSPEWQALLYAFEHHVPARFMDLPQAFAMAAPRPEPEPAAELDRQSPAARRDRPARPAERG